MYYLRDMDFTFGIGSAIGSVLGFASQERTNRANMKLAQYQYEKNLEMWNRENEYNTPANQRKRMEAAGLNPALMYGSGSVANTAGSAPQFDAPKLSAYTDFGDMGVGLGIQAMMAGKQARNVDADTEKKEQETSNLATTQRLTSIDADLRALQVIGQQIANSKSEFERSTMKQLYELQLRQTEATIGRDTAAAALSSSQSGYIDEQAETERQSRPGIVSNIHKTGQKIDADRKAAEASAEASRAAAQSSYAQAKKLAAETYDLTYRQQERLDKLFDKYAAEASNAKSEAELKRIEVDFTKDMKETLGIDPHIGGDSGLIYNFLHMVQKGSKGLKSNSSIYDGSSTWRHNGSGAWR